MNGYKNHAEEIQAELAERDAGEATPGPWRVRGGSDEMFIDAPNTVCLAVVNTCINAPERAAECAANAALIAAAPSLLAALKGMLHPMFLGAAFDFTDACIAIEQARAAVKQAEGRAEG